MTVPFRWTEKERELERKQEEYSNQIFRTNLDWQRRENDEDDKEAPETQNLRQKTTHETRENTANE